MEPPTPTPAEAKAAKRRKRTIRISRDSLLVGVGIAGIAHETVWYHGERPSLLLLFAAMVGLPAYLRRNGI